MSSNTMSLLPYNCNEEVLMDAHNNVNITGKLINEHKRKCEAENATTSTINDELSEIDPDKHMANDLSAHCRYYTQLEFNITFSVSKKFSIIHANIGSTEANLKEYTYYLNDLNIEFTFIILSETWAKEHNTDMHIIPGYKQISCLRKKAKGGGVSIYVHNDISYKLRCDLQFDRKHHETAFVEINKRIFNSKRNIIICAIYRSPKGCMNKFNDELETLLDTLSKEKKHTYIQGDFNINTMYEKFDGKPKDFRFSNIFQSHYFQKIIIDKPTRVTDSSATLLTNTYTNIPDICNRNESGILLTKITDHFPIFTIRSDAELPDKIQFRETRNFSEKNISNFRKLRNKHDWNDLYNIEDINLAFSNFMCSFQSYFNHCFPLEKIKFKIPKSKSLGKQRYKGRHQKKRKTFINFYQRSNGK